MMFGYCSIFAIQIVSVDDENAGRYFMIRGLEANINRHSLDEWSFVTNLCDIASTILY